METQLQTFPWYCNIIIRFFFFFRYNFYCFLKRYLLRKIFQSFRNACIIPGTKRLNTPLHASSASNQIWSVRSQDIHYAILQENFSNLKQGLGNKLKCCANRNCGIIPQFHNNIHMPTVTHETDMAAPQVLGPINRSLLCVISICSLGESECFVIDINIGKLI